MKPWRYWRKQGERSLIELENKKKTTDKKNQSEVVIEDPRKVFSDALVKLGTENQDVLYVSCDSSLGASGGEFNKRFPERHFEFGISEQNAMGEAAGFALCGKIPFISAYMPFITFRCLEQIRDDVCKTKMNVKIMGNNCSFSVSALGATHTILEDIAIIRALPNMTIMSPCDGPEYYQAVFAAAEREGPVFIRIHRMKVERIHEDSYKFEIGKGEVLKEGDDVSIITCSSMVSKSLEAARLLKDSGVNAEVINMPTIKPIDAGLILETGAKTGKVVTVEEHNVVNGFGTAVAEVLIRENPVRMKMIGINDIFAMTGQYEEVLDYYGLTSVKIAESIGKFLET